MIKIERYARRIFSKSPQNTKRGVGKDDIMKVV